METIKGCRVIMELPLGEYAIGLCTYRDKVLLATDRRVVIIEDADDDEKRTIKTMSILP